MDTSQDKVKLVAAAPENILTPDGDIVSTFSIGGRKLVVASEYKSILNYNIVCIYKDSFTLKKILLKDGWLRED